MEISEVTVMVDLDSIKNLKLIKMINDVTIAHLDLLCSTIKSLHGKVEYNEKIYNSNYLSCNLLNFKEDVEKSLKGRGNELLFIITNEDYNLVANNNNHSYYIKLNDIIAGTAITEVESIISKYLKK